MAGNIPVMFTSVTQVLPNVRSGRIRMLAVGAAKRSPVLPDVPTVAESGYPGYEVAVWWGIVAPRGTPRAAMGKLSREITAVLRDPDTRKRLLADAAEPQMLTGAAFRKMVRDDLQKWREVATTARIRLK